MKKKLKKTDSIIYHYKDGKRIKGVPEGISGDLTGVSGNLSGISGDLTGVRGDLSGISGDLTGVRGDLLGVRGDLDECEITQEDRKRGIDVEDLIEE